MGLALFDARLRYVRVNAALAEINGVPAGDHVGRTVLEVLPEQNPEVQEQLRRVRDTGVALDSEVAGYTPRAPGVLRHWRVSYFPVREGDAVVGVGATVVDVSEQTRTEQALRASEARYRSLFENMTEGFAVGEAICDADGRPRDFRLLEMNEAFERHTGLVRREVEGRAIREVLPALEQRWIDAYCGVALSGEPVRFESYNRDLDRHFDVYSYRPAPGRFATVFTDVTLQKRAQQALRIAEQRFRSAVENLPSGLIVADLETGALQWNREALAMHGYPAEDDAHLSVEPLVAEHELRTLSGEPIPVDRWPLPRLLAAKPFRDYELLVRNTQLGWERVFSYSGVVIQAEPGLPPLGLLAIHDVTERTRAETALRAANEQLREADRRKDEFLGMLSHELRNPLAPIRNSIHLLNGAEPSGEQARRARGVIHRQTEHLTRLVDDLLDVTRIARGKIELRRERIDVARLVRRTAEDLRNVLQSSEVALSVDVPDEAVWVDADETRVAQIVGNLLHNAGKFTPPGGEIRVSLRTGGGIAELRVRDTGVGIDPALLPRIFEPFVQSEGSLARTQGGLGLGLALAKGIAELHGGTVRAASEGPGKGAELVVSLPLSPPPGERHVAAGAQAPARGRRVLVVDDNRDAADSLAELVEVMGHGADVAYDGPSALRMAGAARYDVILCDIGLPGMNGYEVAIALRSGPGAGARIVAVSGYAQPEDVARAMDAGFDAHVAKPPNPERIAGLLG